jgi:predicted dehydrogenase
MTAHRVSIGLLGCGGRLRHVVGNLLRESGDRARLVAAYDPDPRAIESLRQTYGAGFEAATTEKEVIDRSDWIFIGSFNNEHARQAISALQAGKDVFCEKPLATTLEDCLAVQKAVRDSGRTFYFGLVLRFAPLYRKMRELLTSGAIGSLISFEFNETLAFNHGGYIFGNWRRQRTLAGSHMLEKCCHDLDLANWLVESLPVRVASFGGLNFFKPENRHHIDRIGPDSKAKLAYQTWEDPHRINPFGDGAEIMDNQVAILQYANGVRCTFHTNCNSGIPERRFYMCGSEGALRADLYQGTVEVSRIGHENKIETYPVGFAGGHAGGDEVMAQALAKSLLEGEAPRATVEDGLRACLVAFALDEAADNSRVVDLLPRWKAAGIAVD